MTNGDSIFCTRAMFFIWRMHASWAGSPDCAVNSDASTKCLKGETRLVKSAGAAYDCARRAEAVDQGAV